MENKQTPSKKWLQFDIDDSENEDDSKSEKEHQREQKIYDCAIEQKDLRQKQNTRSIDKFGANKVSKGFFAQQTEDFQFNEPQETLRIKPPTKQTKEENGEVQSKDYQPKSLPLLQHHESQQQDQQAQKDQGSYQNPCYIGFRSQAILSLQSKPTIKSKLFNLNLSDSEDSSSGKSGSSKEHQKQEEEQPDTQRKSQLDQQLKEQQEPEDQPKSEAKEEHVLQDFVFDKDPQFQVLDEIRPHERLRAMISRSRTGLNMIWPEYQVKLEDGTLILTAKKQSFSLKSTYKIYSKSKDGKERYFGKVQSNLTGNAYTIYVSEDGINEIMKAEVFFPNENRSNQPRHFTTFSLLNGFSLQYLAQEDIKQKEGPFPLQNLYRIPLNRDKVVSMQTRKPVYHQKLRGYVLNFNGRVNVPSIKNIILQKTLTHEEVLMFGRVDKNCFRLQVSHPLNCVIGTAIGLIQFQAKFMD